MSTTALQFKSFPEAHFEFLESKRMVRLALRVEHHLREMETALLSGRLDVPGYQAAVAELRRAIDDVADASRVLIELVE